MIAAVVTHSEEIAARVVQQPEHADAADRKIDRILAGKWGIPVMLLLLGLVLWLTVRRRKLSVRLALLPGLHS